MMRQEWRDAMVRAARAMVGSVAVFGLAVALAACSDSSPTAEPSAGSTTVDPGTAGAIAVEVRYAGPIPAAQPLNMRSAPQCAAAHPEPVLDPSLVVQDGRLVNAFVWIKKGLEGKRFAAPTDPVTMDQKGCMYLPHVVGAMVAQPVTFLNSDPEPHNVHGRPAVVTPWNFMTSRQGASRSITFDKAEVAVPVGCDIHPWMRGYVAVVDHPYFAVTPASGAVTLASVPPGTYTVGVWHETLGTQEQVVTLAASGAVKLEFVFPAAKP
jgi:plastocyanin